MTRRVLVSLLWLRCALALPWAAWGQDTRDTALDSALNINQRMETGLLGLKRNISGLNESLERQTLNLGEATENLNLLLDDYLRLEGLYGDLQRSIKAQLQTLTASLTYAEHRQKFWKKFAAWSVPIAFVLGIAGGLTVCLLSP
ncbi:MAG: hypothetical protein LBK00_10315 [Treponema sp.]|jgi:hypothetical protein|nr:hypothetical protein [Treponema sp.]